MENQNQLTLQGILGKCLKWFLLLSISLFTAFPFIWMLISSLKTKAEVMNTEVIWPHIPQWGNYLEIFTQSPIPKYIWNSLWTSVVIVLIQIVTGAMLAYALVFLRFKGRQLIFAIVMGTYMLPAAATYIPSYIILSKGGMLNTLTGLIVSSTISIFGIFLLRQAFMQVPKSLIEASRMDGASHFRVLWEIVCPMTKSSFITFGLMSFIAAYNSGKETSIGDVTLTFSKELVPVPDIDEEIVIPNIPEKPLVEPEVDSILPLIPLQPLLPIYSTPELPEMEQPDQDSQEISGQSQIVDIVENTQSGMSGQQSSSEETEITEDTRPESDNEIIVGGQSELVDIVEDTQPSLSGHQSESQETVTVEDTQPNQTNILIGGQSEIVDIIEDTQVGMTGQYSSTDQLTIVEDTLPEQMEETDEIKADSQVLDIPKVNDTNNDKGAKASVAFDVEESKVVSTQDINPSTYVKGDNQLPQTGDDDNVNAFFTLAALSVIGAAGLRQNKRREKERN